MYESVRGMNCHDPAPRIFSSRPQNLTIDMSAAVLSPLGTFPSRLYEEEEEEELLDTKNEIMQDDDVSIPSLSDDVFTDMDVIEERYSFSGLVNIGNTCYLNAALQMLASLEGFFLLLESTCPEIDSTLRNDLLHVLQKLSTAETVNPQALKGTIDSLSPSFVGYRQQDSHEFLTILLDLLDEAYKKSEEPLHGKEEDANQDHAQPVLETACPMPMTTSEERPELDTLPSRSLTELQVEDISTLLYGKDPTKASEVLPDKAAAEVPHCKLIGGRAILPLSGMTLAAPVNASQELATVPLQEAEAPSQQERDPTPVDDYFFTRIRARLTCNSCKHTRSHVETYSHLSLEMSSGSVEEGLRTFFAPTSLELKCEKCFCETATKTCEVIKLPRALLLHFKRFNVEVSPNYCSIIYRKNQSPFEFGYEVSLAEFLSEESQTANSCFSLRSVVNHIGSSSSCGHYTADAIRRYPNNEREWTRFNDSRVSQICPEQAMGEASQKTAYMVMYELEPS
jgi:ubiquitin C-terminal hydrolase